MKVLVTFIFLVFSLARPAFGWDEEYLGVPEIPTGSCTLAGGKLCPGIPGNVVQQNLQHGECAESLALLCSDVEPGEGRLANCLREKAHLLDAKCANWGRRVGLDFLGSAGVRIQKQELKGGFGVPSFTMDNDPCSGSAYFTNPSCKKKEEAPAAPEALGIDDPTGLFGVPPTPVMKEDTLAIPTLESLLIKY